MKFNKFSICKIPWNSIFVHPDGTIRPCCIQDLKYGDTMSGETIESVWNSSKAVEFRNQFINGYIPKQCNVCYDKEEKVGSSLRTCFENSQLDNKFHLALSGHVSFDLTHLDISLSNLCNLRCRFCGPHNSTAWIKDELALQKLDANFWSMFMTFDSKIVHQNVDNYIELIKKLPNLRQIEMKGGEPFLVEDQFKLLRFLIDSNRASSLSLNYTTNGTIIKKELETLFPHFKYVNMGISVDGTKDVYKYIRGEIFSLENDVERTIEFFESIPKVRVFIGATLSAYNIFEVANISDWFNKLNKNKNNKKLRFGIVTDPKPLDPTSLPFEIRQIAVEKIGALKDEGLDSLKSALTSPENKSIEDACFSDFVKYTNQLDEVRQTSFLSVVPEYRKYFAKFNNF